MNMLLHDDFCGRVLFSDYDGTFGHDADSLAANLAAAARWRAAGNRFGIITGRGPGLFRPEAERYGIETDYLICANGAAAFDGGRVLRSRRIEPSRVAEAYAFVRASDAVHCLFHTADCRNSHNYRIVFSERSWIAATDVYTPLTDRDVLDSETVLQVSAQFLTETEAAAFARAFNEHFTALSAVTTRDSVDITTAGTSKKTGVDDFLLYTGIAPERVVTVGDAENDAAMLAAYGGYAMFDAVPAAVRAAGGRTCTAVAALIDELLRRP